MYKFICKECKKEFEFIRKNRIFCSDRCARENRKLKEPPQKKVCPTCKIQKNREDFWTSKGKASGLHFECRTCGTEKLKNKPDEWKVKEKIRHKIKSRKKLGLSVDLSISYKRAKNQDSWKSMSNGYIIIGRPNHPNSRKSGMMFEHVFVMSEYLKRSLAKHENVHHKNGLRYDNRIENLELWSTSQPSGQRVDDKIKWCIEFLGEYGYEVSKK
jgi:hypothetical protein